MEQDALIQAVQALLSKQSVANYIQTIAGLTGDTDLQNRLSGTSPSEITVGDLRDVSAAFRATDDSLDVSSLTAAAEALINDVIDALVNEPTFDLGLTGDELAELRSGALELAADIDYETALGLLEFADLLTAAYPDDFSIVDASVATANLDVLDDNDNFYAVQPTDTNLDAMLGEDRAVLSFESGGSTLTISQDSFAVADRDGVGAATVLVNFETIQFPNLTLAVSDFSGAASISSAGFIELAEIYVAYFDRAADALGLYFWADKLSDGLSLAEISELFFDQSETRSLYPDPSDTNAFVTAVYDNVLGRVPDQAGFDFWVGALASNAVSQGAFILEIINGAKALTGSAADAAYLAQKADLGVKFAIDNGLSDTSDATSVMGLFGDQATSNFDGALAAIQSHASDANENGSSDFIVELVGSTNSSIDIV